MVQVHILRLPLANAYLLEGAHDLYLIDCGFPLAHPMVLRAIKRCAPKRLRLILLTHAHIDHYGNALALREATAAPVAIHAADAELLRSGAIFLGAPQKRGKILHRFASWLERFSRAYALEADVFMEDGMDLSAYGLPAYCLHTPGHTPGSSCLIIDEHLAFVGDLLSTNGTAHVQRYFAGDWTALYSSVHRLSLLHPRYIYVGHGDKAMSYDELEALISP